jgi:hypothetical protein
VSAYPARLKRARRFARLAPWISALVLVAGIVTFLIVYFRNTAKPEGSSNPVTPGKPATVQPAAKSVAVPKEAKRVAGRFILTAVQRKNLDEAWKLSGPQIRSGMTYKQWLTGNIAVVPWLGTIGQVPLKVDFSYPGDVEFTVIVTPKPGTKGRPDTFIIALKQYGKQWKVTSWVPYEPPPIPANPGG